MRRDRAAVAIAGVGGAGPLQICYDTFQFYRASDDKLFPEHIGLVHVSGITRRDLPREDLTEPDRGFISMEPFDPRIQSAPDVSEPLQRSFTYLRQGL